MIKESIVQFQMQQAEYSRILEFYDNIINNSKKNYS